MTTPQTPTDGTTMLQILDELRKTGYGGQLIANPDGTIRCTSCGGSAKSDEFDIAGYRRLEGASDAADMNLILWADCPICTAGGTLTLGYGPNASEADTAVLPELDLGEVDEPGAMPGPPSRDSR